MSAAATRPVAGLRARARTPAPAVWLGLGVAAVALVAALTAVAITTIVLDETIYKLAAAQYVGGLPEQLVDDRTSRGMARLYSLLLTPVFAAFDGDVAVRVGRALNGLLWALTAVPVALLARRVVRSPGAAVLAGLLSVAVPWLTVATILFSEGLAYLLFAGTVLAMVRALEAGSWRRQLVVLVLLGLLITTRVQFVVLVPAWLVALLWPQRRALWRRLRDRRVLLGVAGAAVLAVVLLAGPLDGVLRRLAGPYSAIGDRDAYSGDFVLAALVQVELLALGVGVVPVVLAAAWAWRAIEGRLTPDDRRVAALLVLVVGAVFAGTLYAQGGFLDLRTEERYYLYAVPLLWIGALAALERRLVRARALLAGAAVLAALAGIVSVTALVRAELGFLGPVSLLWQWGAPRLSREAGDLTGLAGLLSPRDGVALLVVLVAVAAVLLARTRRPLAALVPAIAVQLVLTGLAVASIHGALAGIPSLTGGPSFAKLGWIDRAIDGRATLIVDPSGRSDALDLGTTFWNDDVTGWLRPGDVPGPTPLYPVNTMEGAFTVVGEDLRLSHRPAERHVVQAVAAPHLQVDGRLVTRSPDGATELRRIDGPATASWWATGLDADGHVSRRVTLLAAPGRRYALTVTAPNPNAPTQALLALGSKEVRVQTAETPQRTVRFDLCRASGPQPGALVPEITQGLPDDPDRASALLVGAVRVEPCG